MLMTTNTNWTPPACENLAALVGLVETDIQIDGG